MVFKKTRFLKFEKNSQKYFTLFMNMHMNHYADSRYYDADQILIIWNKIWNKFFILLRFEFVHFLSGTNCLKALSIAYSKHTLKKNKKILYFMVKLYCKSYVVGRFFVMHFKLLKVNIVHIELAYESLRRMALI